MRTPTRNSSLRRSLNTWARCSSASANSVSPRYFRRPSRVSGTGDTNSTNSTSSDLQPTAPLSPVNASMRRERCTKATWPIWNEVRVSSSGRHQMTASSTITTVASAGVASPMTCEKQPANETTSHSLPPATSLPRRLHRSPAREGGHPRSMIDRPSGVERARHQQYRGAFLRFGYRIKTPLRLRRVLTRYRRYPSASLGALSFVVSIVKEQRITNYEKFGSEFQQNAVSKQLSELLTVR